MKPSEKLLRELIQPEETRGSTLAQVLGVLIGLAIGFGIEIVKVRIILYILGY